MPWREKCDVARWCYLVGSLFALDACGGETGAQSTSGTTAATSGESETGATTGPGETDTGGEQEEGFEPYPWPDEALTELVGPRIGTGGVGYTVGTVNPGPSLSFGMIKPGPASASAPTSRPRRPSSAAAPYTPLQPVPHYWQSNEPSLHDAYLFTELGDPASTQRWVLRLTEPQSSQPSPHSAT